MGENLAWNTGKDGGAFIQTVEQWYREKGDYIKKRAGQPHGVTGHYESLINPSFTHMGLGAFDIEPSKWTGVAQLFATPRSTLDESGEDFSGPVTQTLEAIAGDVSGLAIHGVPANLTSPTHLHVTGTLTPSQGDQDWLQRYARWAYPTVAASLQSGVVWTSSDPSIISVDANGTISPQGYGSTVITARVGNHSVQTRVLYKGIVALDTSISRSIKSGEQPSLPASVQATWSDGSTSQEPVSWSSADMINVTTSPKTVTLVGRVNGSTVTAQAQVTIHGIRSLASFTQSIKSGQTPSLPKTLQASWTDGTTSPVSVTWQSADFTNKTTSVKTVTVLGRVAGSDLQAKSAITVHGMKSLSLVTRKVRTGTAPVLPKTLTATWTDGSTTQEPVVWATISPQLYTVTKPTQFTVAGKVTASNLTARATVHVATVQAIHRVSASTRTGTEPILPTIVTLVWTDGGLSTAPVKWNRFKTSDYTKSQQATFSWQGTVSGVPIPALADVTVHVPVTVEPATVTTLSDQAPILPTSLTTTWSDGSRSQEPIAWDAILPAFYQKQYTDTQFYAKGQLLHHARYQTGIPVQAVVKVVAQTIPLYRLYHPGLKVHLYTKDLNEYSILGERGWNQEGLAWHTASAHGDKVYRLYHPGLKVHLYTKDLNEYGILATRGWKQEGIAFYAVK